MRTPLEISGWAHPTPDTWILHFAWPTNPLPMNGSRGHRLATARKAKNVRIRSGFTARMAGIPTLGRIRAQLTWWVATNRTRDPDNLAQLEKPIFDGLVDAGIVTDDRPELMDKPRAVIRPVADSAGLVTEPGFTLTITHLEEPTNG